MCIEILCQVGQVSVFQLPAGLRVVSVDQTNHDYDWLKPYTLQLTLHPGSMGA